MRSVRPFDPTSVSHPLAVVLGTNEIASAVAVFLHRGAHAVVLAHDPSLPVLRRGMAFHDALYGDSVSLEGVEALRIDYVADLYPVLAEKNRVAISDLGLTDLLILGAIDVIVDARMQRRPIMPDFRGLARVTVGLGAGFVRQENCDLAIETHELLSPATPNDAAGHYGIEPEPAGAPPARRELHAYASVAGRWRTAVDIGTRVFKGFIIGHVGGFPVQAPIDGVLRGIARDGLEVPAGAALAEMDPRGRSSRWTGIEDGPRLVAEATLDAVRKFAAAQRGVSRFTPHLI